MKKIKVLAVFGTRPEAIKMAPLVQELTRRSRQFDCVVCVTAQHRQMLDQVLEIFHITPKYDLDIMKPNQTLSMITANVLIGLAPVLEKEKPDIVLVHGDTTTSMCAALAAFYQQIKVGHVEAGLRTYNKFSPFPEEINRQLTGVIADLHFAPTQTAKENLLREGKDADAIFVTGNTAIDALQTTVSAHYVTPLTAWAEGSRLLVLTAHRRENIGQSLENIYAAVNRITQKYPDVKVICPVHPNPKVQEVCFAAFAGNDRIRTTAPMDAIEFHNLMSKAYLILTDSGGIQEEAPHLGKPVLVLRDTTERPEGVVAGTLKLIGTDEDVIFNETSILLEDYAAYRAMAQAQNPYGDGHASERIADAIRTAFQK